MNEPSPDNAPGRNAHTVLQEAMQQHRQGNSFEADLLYAESLRIEPHNNKALRLRGILARENGDLDKSLHLLEQARQAAPASSEVLGEIALSYMASGRLGEAETVLRQALKLDPAATRIITNLGALQQHRGHVQSAVACYQQALQIDGEDIGVRCNLAKALSDTGQSDAALEECTIAATIAGEHPHILATRGAVLTDMQDYAAARKVLEQATHLAPDDDMALVNLALACYELKDLSAATAALRRAVGSNPYNARAVADLANCLTAATHVSAAIELCEGFLQQHPGERLVLGAYALALHNAGRSDESTALTDCATLVRVFDVPCPAGYENLAAFNAALAQRINNDTSLISGPVSKATTGGEQTGELDMQEDGCLADLGKIIDEIIRAAADSYIDADLARHPLMAVAGNSWSLRTWGTVLRTGGRQAPHMHPLGWLSGVYYASLPADMDQADAEAGWLEFGTPPERFFRQQEPEQHRYQPAEGRLVLFPSWFWHQTVPFVAAANVDRISIAFDVMPKTSLRIL